MTFFKYPHLYTRLVDTIPTVLPWNQGNPSEKGDPRKSVKWIDVCIPVQSIQVPLSDLTEYTGPSRDSILPRRPHTSRPRLGLRPLLPTRQRRRSPPNSPMAHPPHTLARPHRRDHLRLSHRLCLRAEATQARSSRRYNSSLHNGVEERIPQTTPLDIPGYYCPPYLMDCGSVWRVCCG